MGDDIREKLWNIDMVVDDIKKFPQTYNTILGELKDDGTCQQVLRRKMSNLCKNGMVCKAMIPGTRFGKIIFYVLPKDYHILVEGTRMGSVVYCFFKFEKLNNAYIFVNNLWALKNSEWVKIKNKKFFDGNVLKWI